MEKKVYSEQELNDVLSLLSRRLDRIEELACLIERAGWEIYRSAENERVADFGAEMAALGSHMNWYLNNDSDVSRPFDVFDRIQF